MSTRIDVIREAAKIRQPKTGIDYAPLIKKYENDTIVVGAHTGDRRDNSGVSGDVFAVTIFPDAEGFERNTREIVQTTIMNRQHKETYRPGALDRIVERVVHERQMCHVTWNSILFVDALKKAFEQEICDDHPA